MGSAKHPSCAIDIALLDMGSRAGPGTVGLDMAFRSTWLMAGWPLMCSALNEGLYSLPEQTFICPPKWVAAAWAFSGTALTLCSLTLCLAPTSWWHSRGGGDPRGGMRSCAARVWSSSEKGISMDAAMINPIGTHSLF